MKTGNFMGLFGALLVASIVGGSTAPVPRNKIRGYNYAIGGYNPEYHPRHSKFKGWMRERRRCTFNKNR